jgi:uncharacterized membrane protein YtjA (UPF0391 family)
MIGWPATLFIMSLIAGIFGLGATAGAAVGIAWLPLVAGLIFVILKRKPAQPPADESS